MSCTNANFYNIQPLSLSDTFHTWFDRTNEVIDVVNGVNVLSVEAGATGGLKIENGCSGGYYNGVVAVSAKVSSGVGIGTPNFTVGGAGKFNHIVMDFSEMNSFGASANPSQNDYFVVSDVSDLNMNVNTGTPKRIKATHILPDRIVMGDGAADGGSLEIDADVTIVGELNILGDLTYIDSNDVRIEDKILELAYARYAEFQVTGSNIPGIAVGMTAYYNDPGEGFTTTSASTIGVIRGITGNANDVIQLHKFDEGGVRDIVVNGGLFIGSPATGSTFSVITTPTVVVDFYSDSTLSPAGISIKSLNGDKNFLWTNENNRFGVNTNFGVTGQNGWINSANFSSYDFDDGSSRDNTFTFMGLSGAETRITLASGSPTAAGTENSYWSFVKRSTPEHGNTNQVLSLLHYAGNIVAGGNVPANTYYVANFIAGPTGTFGGHPGQYPGVGMSGWAQNLNVDQLDGAHAYISPSPYSIPVAGADGKIDPDWLASSAVRRKIYTPGHAFFNGDIVRFDLDDASLTFAQADTIPTAEAIGMVSLIEGDYVTITTHGFVVGITDSGTGRLAGLGSMITGNVYFLSPTTPGGMIVDPNEGPSALDVGEVRKAMYLHMGASAGAGGAAYLNGYILTHPGTIVGGDNQTDVVVFPQLSPVGSIMPFAGPIDRFPIGWLLCDGRIYDRNEYDELFSAIGNVNSVPAKMGSSSSQIIISGSTRDIRTGDMIRLGWGVSNSHNAVVTNVVTGTRTITFSPAITESIPAENTDMRVYGRDTGSGSLSGRPTFFVPDLRGRTIFGVSNYVPPSGESIVLDVPSLSRGDFGGRDEVELGSSNIPDHAHGTFDQQVSPPAVNSNIFGTLDSRTDDGISGVNDFGDPFSIMPPYVVTHWLIRYTKRVNAIILTGHDHDNRYIRYDLFHGPPNSQQALTEANKRQFWANANVLSDGVLGADTFYNRLIIDNVPSSLTSDEWDWWTSGIYTVDQAQGGYNNQAYWSNAGLNVMGGDSRQASINIFNNNSGNYWSTENQGGWVDGMALNFWGVGISGATFPARYAAGIDAIISSDSGNYSSENNMVTRRMRFHMGGKTASSPALEILRREDPSTGTPFTKSIRFFFPNGITSAPVHTSQMKHVMLRNGSELVEYTSTALSGSDIFSSGDLIVAGGLTVGKDAHFLEDVFVDGVFNVISGAVTGANINTNTSIGGNLSVSGDALFGGSGHFKGNLKVDGGVIVNLGNIEGRQNLLVNGNISVTGNVICQGDVQADYIKLTGKPVDTGGGQTINTAIDANGRVNIVGANAGLSANGDVIVGGKLFVGDPGIPDEADAQSRSLTINLETGRIDIKKMFTISESDPPTSPGAIAQYPDGFVWYKVRP